MLVGTPKEEAWKKERQEGFPCVVVRVVIISIVILIWGVFGLGVVLRIKTRVLCIQSKCYVTELHPSPAIVNM